MNLKLQLAVKHPRQMRFALRILTDGFTTKGKINVSKLDIAVVHKKGLQLNKNVKSASKTGRKRKQRTHNTGELADFF